MRSMPSRALTTRFPTCAMILPHYLEAHGPGGTFDHRHGGFDRCTIQIDDLLLGDLADLGPGDAPDRPAARGLRSAGDAGGLLEPERHRRQLELEGEGAGLIGGAHHRNPWPLLHL